MEKITKGYYFADVGTGQTSSIIRIRGEAPFLSITRIDLFENTFSKMDSLDGVKLYERIPQFDALMGIGV